MNHRRKVRDFLVSRRAKITAEQAGLTAFGSNPRVAGPRGEEVAMIAGGLRRLLPQRMRENIDVFDFALTDDESARITTLDTGAQLRVRPPRPRLTSVSGRPAAPPASTSSRSTSG